MFGNRTVGKIVEAISWGDRVEDVSYCYSFCFFLTGPIPDWGPNITNAEGCYSNCTGLKGNIPEWNSILTNVSFCYGRCSQLTGNIPKWNSTITKAYSCFRDCKNLLGIWNSSAPIEEVCPERIITHDFCIAGCSETVKKHFLKT